jgi:hypothetical protein
MENKKSLLPPNLPIITAPTNGCDFDHLPDHHGAYGA